MKVALQVWRAFGQDKVLRLAAAVAFSALFSLAPLLVVLIAIAGWFLGLNNGGHGHHLAESAILDEVRRSAGPDASAAVGALIAAAFGKPRAGIIAQVVGWVAFVFGAAGLFASVQDALNAIWQVESSEGGWRRMVRDRVLALLMVAIAAVLLLGTTVLNTVVAFAGAPAGAAIGQLAIAAAACVAFAAIYRVLPDVRVAWRDVWLGAAVTAVLFVGGEWLIAFYITRASVTSAYGAAGSIFALLLWIYYSAIAFLVGAEFTKVCATRAATIGPAQIRTLQRRPAGIDPRFPPAEQEAARRNT